MIILGIVLGLLAGTPAMVHKMEAHNKANQAAFDQERFQAAEAKIRKEYGAYTIGEIKPVR